MFFFRVVFVFGDFLLSSPTYHVPYSLLHHAYALDGLAFLEGRNASIP